MDRLDGGGDAAQFFIGDHCIICLDVMRFLKICAATVYWDRVYVNTPSGYQYMTDDLEAGAVDYGGESAEDIACVLYPLRSIKENFDETLLCSRRLFACRTYCIA